MTLGPVSSLIIGTASSLLVFYSVGSALNTKQRQLKINNFLFGYAALSIIYFLIIIINGDSKHNSLLYSLVLFTTMSTAVHLLRTKTFNIRIFLNLQWFSVIIIAVISVLVPISNTFQENQRFYEYFHSGSNDIFDGICGAESLIFETSSEQKMVGIRVGPEHFNNNLELSKQNLFTERWVCNQDKTNYIIDLGRIQYSNLALFSDFLRAPPSLWSFINQTVINLFLFFIAVYQLGKFAFGFRRRLSISLATISCLSHLHFTTIINGHIGTLMVSSSVVMFMLYIFSRDNSGVKKRLRILDYLLLLFIGLTYPFILPFILLTKILVDVFNHNAAGRFTRSKIFRILFILSTPIILSYFVLFNLRSRASFEFRSWHSFITPLGFFQYFGIIPGNMLGSNDLGLFQEQLFQYFADPKKIIIYVFIFSALATLLLFIPRELDPKRRRLKFFTFIFMYMEIWVYVVTKDSYYVYKIAYIFQFMVIGIFIILANNLRRIKGFRSISYLVFTALTFANLYWNFSAINTVIEGNQRWVQITRFVDKADGTELSRSISMLPESADSNILAFLVSHRRGITTNSSGDKTSGISTIQNPGGRQSFIIRTLPPDTFRVSNYGTWGVEGYDKEKFRWVSGTKFNATSQMRAISVSRINSSKKPLNLNLCTSLAEWLDIEELHLKVVSSNGSLISEVAIFKKRSCQQISIPSDVNTFFIGTLYSAPITSFADGRRLVFRIWQENNGSQSSLF